MARSPQSARHRHRRLADRGRADRRDQHARRAALCIVAEGGGRAADRRVAGPAAADALRLDRAGGARSASGAARSEARLRQLRSEEHTSELQSLMRISYAVFCLQKKKNNTHLNIRNM